MLQLWRSHSDSVFQNMAMENWLLKRTSSDHLFFWVNRPAVVIGRNQIPWHEVNFANVYRDGVDFVRRVSGGGAVYHDQGNLNISFIAATTAAQHMATVQAVLSDLGIVADIGARNELTVTGKKISGSAYYLYRKRRLHHMTLLISADLRRVWQYLLPKASYQSTTAVASVRQAVTNLSCLQTGLTIDDVIAAFAKRYQTVVQPLTLDDNQLQAAVQYYQSWRWNFGCTPTFVDGDATERITVKRGRISDVEGFEDVTHHMIGQLYHPNCIASRSVHV